MSDKKNELLPTRASLLERMRDWQNQTSWQEFFDLYWKLIYGVARKAGLSDSEAQDVVQEVLVHVAKQMPTFRFDPALGSFKREPSRRGQWPASRARVVVFLRVRLIQCEPSRRWPLASGRGGRGGGRPAQAGRPTRPTPLRSWQC